MAQTKPKPRLVGNISVGGPVLAIDDIRRLAANEPKGFMQKVEKAVDEGKLTWSSFRRLDDLWHALADVEVPVRVMEMGRERAVMASAFPLLSGSLTVAGFNAAYEAVPTIGQELVTEMEDNKRVTSIAQITSLDTATDRVDEGVDFPEIQAGETRFDIRSKRNGRMLTITSEMIEENDVAGIVSRVNALGEIAAELTEEQTLRRVCDIDGSATSPAEPYVLHLNGTGTQLYNSTANNPGTQAPSGTRVTSNALVDETDFENARTVLAAMKNSRGKRIAIPISRCTLLVPDALVGTAAKTLNSEYTPGVENEVNTWGPRGLWRPRLLSSPKLDDLSTTAWYLGWFERQFIRKWKLRMEYVTLSGVTEAFLKRRTAFQARIAWDCEVGAQDYVYVVQNLSDTTAP